MKNQAGHRVSAPCQILTCPVSTISEPFAIHDVVDLTLGYFKHYGEKGSNSLMIEQFEARIEMAKFKGLDAIEEEREYLEFLSHDGHRLINKTA